MWYLSEIIHCNTYIILFLKFKDVGQSNRDQISNRNDDRLTRACDGMSIIIKLLVIAYRLLHAFYGSLVVTFK